MILIIPLLLDFHKVKTSVSLWHKKSAWKLGFPCTFEREAKSIAFFILLHLFLSNVAILDLQHARLKTR